MSKINDNKLVPKLRFPEFRNEGDWIEDTLINLAGFRRGSFPQPYGLPEWYDDINGMPFIQVYDVGEDFRLKPKTKNKISKLAAEQSVFIPKGTVIITIQGSIGRVAITQYDAYIDRTLLLFEEFYQEIDKTFFAYILFLLFEIEKLKAPGGIIKTITKEVLSQFIVKLPKLKEQKKIGNCLASLDEVIAAENQRLEILNEHKIGLLQNLLPQEGETVPKFRFSEFQEIGDWEETTLTQVAEYENGKAHEQDISDDGEFIVVNSKFISQDGEVKKFTNTAFLPATKGDVLMVLSDIPNGKAIAKCFLVEEDNRYTVNQRICRLTPRNLNSKILYYLLNRNPYFLAFDDGVKQTNLRKEDVLNFPLLIPSDPKEQDKIAQTLSSIDELINAQSQKVEALKRHKKGLLQGLFPDVNEINE
jgi:type I restriction enzyme S subunit